MSARAIILGTVGRDPELKMTPGGLSYAKFSVATKAGKKLKTGEWAPDRWWEVVAFGDLADEVGRNVRRGSYIEAEGKFDFEEYDKRDGSRGQKFICKAERVTEKEKPARAVQTPQRSAEVEKPMTGWGKAHEASLLPDSPRDPFDRENHYSSGSDIDFSKIPF